MRKCGVLLLVVVSSCAEPVADLAAPPPDFEARFSSALGAVSREQYVAAAELLEPLLIGTESHPKRAEVLFLLAEVNYQRGELESAAEQFEDLARRHPESTYARAVPARLLAIGTELRDRAPATVIEALARDRRAEIDALGKAAVDDPSAERAADAFIELAAAHLADGDGELAVRALERMIERHPDSPRVEEARFRLAEAWRAQTRGAGYDPQPLLEARLAALRYLERYGPSATHALDAARIVHDATAELVAHELRIADFYAARGNEVGATAHRENAKALQRESDAAGN